MHTIDYQNIDGGGHPLLLKLRLKFIIFILNMAKISHILSSARSSVGRAAPF